MLGQQGAGGLAVGRVILQAGWHVVLTCRVSSAVCTALASFLKVLPISCLLGTSTVTVTLRGSGNLS